MIDHAWTVVCTHAVVDRYSNNASLLDVVEQISIKAEPNPEGSLPISLDVMTLWTRADLDVPSRGHGRVTFLSPLGRVNDGPFEFDIDLSEHRRNRTRGQLGALHIAESGRHIFRVELQNEGETEWHQVAAIPLEVIFEPPETAEQEVSELEQD